MLREVRGERQALPLSDGAILAALKVALKCADRPDRLADSELCQLAVVTSRTADTGGHLGRAWRRSCASFRHLATAVERLANALQQAEQVARSAEQASPEPAPIE